MESIALFGGSFDPPHTGHKAIVEAAQNLKEIDKVVIMPTYLNPFKSKSHSTPKQRLKMVKEMFDSYDKVEISDFEVLQKQKVPSIITVKHLLKMYDKIYLIIGADNLESLHKWQDYDELKKLVTFIVAKRDNIEIPKKYITLDVNENISSTEIRKKEK
ncbi:nicotinate (nicotinamide) nucleotide adenylyltransferase [Sulfurimonas lithotrophica]|uniref:Probable nicotinate-nucleotide adenylyltransferase n=1 Tax=Sulfurimonas lithotrophica TaxID=2590022 RepID=A0A5P8P344_9BACT|nr:nicotinate (nicotinamide) nucleotide adenylyltransferase [Sulfurimonas lithotrophica]QFR49970.1 nicotinate (nicotinamide) nucleotide adenylyltransferase [Sulfurimonas lithotrophica]